MRTATREKISQLRNNPNISSVEMTSAGDEKKADKDYDGDGKVESGTDEYMGSRDKAIKKAIAAKKEEVDTQLKIHQEFLNATLDKMEEGVRDLDPEKGTKERKARLEKKRGMKVDDHPEYKKEEVEQVDEADSLAAMQARREASCSTKKAVKALLHLEETLVTIILCLLINKRREEMLSLRQDSKIEPRRGS